MKRKLPVPIVLLAVIAALAGFFAWRSREFRLIAVLPSADGLRVGDPVASSHGMLIGDVVRMRISGRRILVELRVSDRDVELRRSDSVRVRALGGNRNALEVITGDPAAPRLGRGDTLYFAPLTPPARLHAENHDIGRTVVDRVGPDEIAAALGGVSRTSAGVVFPDSYDEHAQYVFNRRSTPSAVEQHDQWDDILIVQAGRGAVRYGGPWRNATMRYQGERRGGSLDDPTTVQLGPGDVVRIPAGEPHRILPEGDTPLTYLVVKVRINRRSQPSGAGER